jgi:hypothetical protein
MRWLAVVAVLVLCGYLGSLVGEGPWSWLITLAGCVTVVCILED